MKTLLMITLVATVAGFTVGDTAAPQTPGAAAAPASQTLPASPEALYNAALAALRADQPQQAQVLADRAVVAGGAAFVPLRDFVFGNAAFIRCDKAEAVAGLAEAEPFAFDTAISQAESALRWWRAAAMTRPDWPAARRNIERALLKIDALRAKKAAANASRDHQKAPDKPNPRLLPQPPTRPTPPASKDPARDNVAADAQTAPLSPAEVLRLIERLDAQELEKLKLRRARRRQQSGGVERDW